MPYYEYYGLIAVGVGLTAAVSRAIHGAIARRRVAKRLADGLDQLTDGAPATLIGVVRATGKTLEAPLSGKPCVAYEARCKHRSRSQIDRIPDTIRIEIMPFELETERGPVRVEGATAEFAFDVEPLVPRNLDREAGFAADNGIETSLRDASFQEIRVEVGARVAVHGVVTVEVAPASGETGFRDAGTRLAIHPHPDHPLTIGAVR